MECRADLQGCSVVLAAVEGSQRALGLSLAEWPWTSYITFASAKGGFRYLLPRVVGRLM